MDMHSGGGLKEKAQYIYIEAPEAEAKVIFYNKFGHNPDRVSCTCCGSDYSISSGEDLVQLTGYDRGCRSLETPTYKSGKKKGLYKPVNDPAFKAHYYLEDGEEPPKGYAVSVERFVSSPYQPLRTFLKRKDIIVIRKWDILAKWRKGDVPVQGYVWQD
jgi:hypothetical protein